jgi:hypothetical protein
LREAFSGGAELVARASRKRELDLLGNASPIELAESIIPNRSACPVL